MQLLDIAFVTFFVSGGVISLVCGVRCFSRLFYTQKYKAIRFQ